MNGLLAPFILFVVLCVVGGLIIYTTAAARLLTPVKEYRVQYIKTGRMTPAGQSEWMAVVDDEMPLSLKAHIVKAGSNTDYPLQAPNWLSEGQH